MRAWKCSELIIINTMTADIIAENKPIVLIECAHILSSKHRQIKNITQPNTNNKWTNNEQQQKWFENFKHTTTTSKKKVEAPKKWTSDRKKELNKYHR